MPVFATLSLLAYLLSLGLIIPSLLRKKGIHRRWTLIAAVIALIFHGISLQQRVFNVDHGQNLSLLNIASGASLLMSAIMTFVASRDRGWILLPVVYSFSIINLALSSFTPWEFITHLEDSPALLTHIVLALFSYATLIIAALYALQLAWIDYQLKNKKLSFSPDMPPLLSIERKTFHITQIGVILLTLTLATGVLFLDNLLDPENLHKTVLSTIAWLVYLTLLWGHYSKGWRGRKVVWFSLSGALLLTLGYFGSRLVQVLLAQ
ncbi:MAG: inner membrane protein YpjD [Enterobacteriaceae bacterium]|nr:inner membrane protein YpjD [Enterobacteriaceae bacterium]